MAAVQDVIALLEGEGLAIEGERVLVTGGAGFLGSWVCEALLQFGKRVVCVDNLASGLRSNIVHLKGEFQFVKSDVSEPLELEDGFDLVLHMASRASPFEFDKYPIEILRANTFGIVNALEVARVSGARFLYTSTSEVYGDPDPKFVPTPESYNGNVSTTGPRGCYDEGKRAGEAYVTAYHRQYYLDTRMVRIFNTYGPRMRADDIYGRVVPRFISQALHGEDITVFGDGTQTRSFTYVTDQLEGILRALAVDGIGGDVFNIGNENETTVLELAELVKRLTDSRSDIVFRPLPKDDPRRRCPDISKAKRVLHWTPRTGLEEGLQKTIEGFKGKR
ncbi:MAG: UDP-glucuronic acid decarboxylase family protein [Candidatus Hydrothermarchaeota archaeon]